MNKETRSANSQIFGFSRSGFTDVKNNFPPHADPGHKIDLPNANLNIGIPLTFFSKGSEKECEVESNRLENDIRKENDESVYCPSGIV